MKIMPATSEYDHQEIILWLCLLQLCRLSNLILVQTWCLGSNWQNSFRLGDFHLSTSRWCWLGQL